MVANSLDSDTEALGKAVERLGYIFKSVHVLQVDFWNGFI